MTTDSRDQASFSRRRKRRQSRARQTIGRVCSEWRVEIIIVILVILGIFLLVEKMQIRLTLLHGLRQALQDLNGFGKAILGAVVSFFRNTTISDLAGYTLLLVAAVFVAMRIRWRLMTLPRFTTQACPRCGGELHRIKRRRVDRLLNLYVPVRRYQCKDHNCRWQGLRVSTSRHV